MLHIYIYDISNLRVNLSVFTTRVPVKFRSLGVGKFPLAADPDVFKIRRVYKAPWLFALKIRTVRFFEMSLFFVIRQGVIYRTNSIFRTTLSLFLQHQMFGKSFQSKGIVGCWLLFIYLGTTLTNQNSTQEEIKIRLKLGMLAITRCRIFCLPVCCLKI